MSMNETFDKKMKQKWNRDSQYRNQTWNETVNENKTNEIETVDETGIKQ